MSRVMEKGVKIDTIDTIALFYMYTRGTIDTIDTIALFYMYTPGTKRRLPPPYYYIYSL